MHRGGGRWNWRTLLAGRQHWPHLPAFGQRSGEVATPGGKNARSWWQLAAAFRSRCRRSVAHPIAAGLRQSVKHNYLFMS